MNRHEETHMAMEHAPRFGADLAYGTARGLGWFSIALGLAECLMPHAVARAVGMPGQERTVRAYGLREIATQSHAKAEYLKGRIAALPGYRIPYPGPTFNEFVVEAPEPAAPLLERLARRGILGGVPLSRYDAEQGRWFLVAVTELNTRGEMDRFAAALGESA